MAAAVVSTKMEWRKHFRSELQSFYSQQNGELKSEAEIKIQKLLLDFLGLSPGIWGGYMALDNEPSLEVLFSKKKNQQWVYSKVEGEELKWFQPSTKGFIKGSLGVLEPVSEGLTPVSLDDIQGLIIPGLGFDRQGIRLGRGKGFYDRMLRNFKGLKVGVAFGCQLTDVLPSESHDAKMDLVISEKGLFKPNLNV